MLHHFDYKVTGCSFLVCLEVFSCSFPVHGVLKDSFLFCYVFYTFLITFYFSIAIDLGFRDKLTSI